MTERIERVTINPPVKGDNQISNPNTQNLKQNGSTPNSAQTNNSISPQKGQSSSTKQTNPTGTISKQPATSSTKPGITFNNTRKPQNLSTRPCHTKCLSPDKRNKLSIDFLHQH